MTSYFSGFYPEETADGAKGSAAFAGATNIAILQLYKRSATTLGDSDKPNGVVTYTFATAVSDLSTITNGWTSTIPSGTDPLYVVGATAASSEPTDTIAINEWSSPVILVQNGTGGLNTATVFLFKRGNTSTLPAVPTQSVTYTFASGIALGSSSTGNTVSPYLDGWSQTAPDSAGNKYLFMITGTAISTGANDTIASTEWSTVRIMAEDGAQGYTAYLTNETHTLTASSAGVVTDYTGASGDFKIFLDGVGDISSAFTLSTVAGSNTQGLTIAYPPTTTTYNISGGFDSAEDTASITIRATGSGLYTGVILDKVFSLSKAKAGTDGSSPKTLSVSASRQLISFNGAGALNPATQTTTLTATKQNTTGTVNWTIQDLLGNPLTTLTYLSAATGDSVTMTAANFQAAISVNGSEGVVIIGTIVDGVTISDRVSIMKVKSGADGNPGSNGVSPISVSLSKPSVAIATDTNGDNGVFTVSSTEIAAFEGQTSLTFDGVGISSTGNASGGTSPGTWRIGSRVATNVGLGTTITDTGTLATVSAITGMTADTGSIVYNISGTSFSGTPFTASTTQTFAKVRGGVVDTNPPAAPADLVLSSTTITTPSGDIQVKLNATWTANSEPDFSYYEIQIKEGTGSYISYNAPSNNYEWLVKPNTAYTVQLRAIDKNDNRSAYGSAATTTSTKDNLAPAVTTGITAVATFKNIFLSWTNPADADLGFVEVYRNTSDVSGSAIKVGTVSAGASGAGVFTDSSGISNGTLYYYWLKSIDTSGNASALTTTSSSAITGVVITGTAGQFSCTSNTLRLGQVVIISGTLGGTGAITGYTTPKTYVISATNGTTTFTLVNTDGTPIVTTAGTPTGLTYTRLLSAAVPAAVGQADIIAGSITADRIRTGEITSDIIAIGTGLNSSIVVSGTGTTIGSTTSNASSAFSGTTKYRTAGAPTNAPTPTSLSATLNTNGSRNIRLNWGAYTQGTNQADLLILFWNKTATAPTTSDASIAFNINVAASYHVFEGVNPADTFSFGIAAARRTESGLEIGAIQTIAAWTNVAVATANYTANVDGTSAATVVTNAATGAQDPGTRINAGSTTIDPGKILISGATTLSNWRNGTDATKIEGGSIAANTISANKIEIGIRGLDISGITFQCSVNASAASTNIVTWSDGGKIVYTDDNGNIAERVITGGANTAWSSGIQYFYWTKGGTSINVTTATGTAYGPDKIVLATYSGGFNLVVNYGKTIIDGSQITTGTITGTQVKALSITADQINSNGLSIKDANGNVILSAGSAVDFSSLLTSFPNATNTGSVSNSNINISGGAISGIGTGSGTVVDNAQVIVGSTNLLLNSGKFTNTNNWSDNGGGLSVDTVVTYAGYNTLKIPGTAVGGIGAAICRVESDTIYTVSALVKASANINSSGYDTTLHIQQWRDEDVTNLHQETPISSDSNITTSWRLITQTFRTVASANAGYVRLYFYPLEAGKQVNIAYAKLEKGNKATDWTPNPEEVRNTNITVSGGAIGGIGTGSGTVVDNASIAVNGSGQLTGIGTGVNTVVANGQIAINTSNGQITGIGTGTGTAVANSSIAISGGAITGIGTGNNTTVANSSIAISGGAITGIGTGNNTTVANSSIAISGGAITGIGTGNNTAVANSAITINSSGAISGAGGGQVTIGGLGYSGDLNATNGATIGSNLVGTFSEAEFNTRFTSNSINGTFIKNATIDTAQIKDLAVSEGKIVNAAITNAKIGNLEVDSAKIANLTIGTQKITDLSITASSNYYNDFNGSLRTTGYNFYYDITTTGTTCEFVLVGSTGGTYIFDPYYGYYGAFVVASPAGTGTHNYVCTSASAAQVSVVTSASGVSGSQKVYIDAMMVLSRDGGDDDNIDVRILRNGVTELPQVYTGIQVFSGRRPYTFFFVDSAPVAGATNTYKLQIKNVPSDGAPYIYDVSLRGTLYRK